MPVPRIIGQCLLRLPGRQRWLERRALKACETHNLDELKACLDAGLAVDVLIKRRNTTEPLFFTAAYQAFEKGFQLLLNKGADPMMTSPSWNNPATRNHILMVLVHFGVAKVAPMVRMLVEAGADVDASRGWELNWNSTFIDECGDPIGDHNMMSFREVIIQKKGNSPEWHEMLIFADNLKRVRVQHAHMDATVLKPEALAIIEVQRF